LRYNKFKRNISLRKNLEIVRKTNMILHSLSYLLNVTRP
jgi:hypothetical protein